MVDTAQTIRKTCLSEGVPLLEHAVAGPRVDLLLLSSRHRHRLGVARTWHATWGGHRPSVKCRRAPILQEKSNGPL